MADGLIYRQARPEDVPAIARFANSVLIETGAQKATLLDDAFYRWQYDVERDVIVIALEGDEVLAHYPLVTYDMRRNGRDVKAGVCQDLSVSDRLRGRGVFKELGLLANELAAAKGLDILFAFPNHRSIPGFLKHHGYTLTGEVGWHAAVIDPTQMLPGAALKKLLRLMFSSQRRAGPTPGPWDVGPFAEVAIPPELLGVPRTNEFINWRFHQRPYTEYAGFVEEEAGAPAAWASLRVSELKGLRVGLIMDLAFAPGAHKAASRLLSRCRSYLRGEGAALAFMIATPRVPVTRLLRKAGFMPMPYRLSPRRLNLVARALNPACQSLVTDIDSWHLTFADWDVF